MSIGAHFVGGVGHLGEDPALNILADLVVCKETSLPSDRSSSASSRSRGSERCGRRGECPGTTVGGDPDNQLALGTSSLDPMLYTDDKESFVVKVKQNLRSIHRESVP